MAVTYQQTDTTVTLGTKIMRIIEIGGVAGTASISVTAGSAGAGIQEWARFISGAPSPDTGVGTGSWIGASTIRWEISTSNANLTWSSVTWQEYCRDVAEVNITVTSGLALSLGTTGVKTASIESTVVYNITCATNSACIAYKLFGTSAATMVGVFTWRPTSTITAPFTTGSGTAAAASVYNLASTRAGK